LRPGVSPTEIRRPKQSTVSPEQELMRRENLNWRPAESTHKKNGPRPARQIELQQTKPAAERIGTKNQSRELLVRKASRPAGERRSDLEQRLRGTRSELLQKFQTGAVHGNGISAGQEPRKLTGAVKNPSINTRSIACSFDCRNEDKQQI
jgi:hypothetical protein